MARLNSYQSTSESDGRFCTSFNGGLSCHHETDPSPQRKPHSPWTEAPKAPPEDPSAESMSAGSLHGSEGPRWYWPGKKPDYKEPYGSGATCYKTTRRIFTPRKRPSSTDLRSPQSYNEKKSKSYRVQQPNHMAVQLNKVGTNSHVMKKIIQTQFTNKITKLEISKHDLGWYPN